MYLVTARVIIQGKPNWNMIHSGLLTLILTTGKLQSFGIQQNTCVVFHLQEPTSEGYMYVLLENTYQAKLK